MDGRLRLYSLTIQQFKVEEDIPAPAVNILISSYYGIIAASFLSFEGIFSVKSVFRANLTSILWLPFLLMQLALLIALGFALRKKYKIEEKPSFGVKITSYMKMIYIYVFTPFSVWLFGYPSFSYLDESGGPVYSAALSAFSCILLFLCIVLNMLFLQLMRNSYPTEGKLSTPNINNETIVYFLLLIMQLSVQIDPLLSTLTKGIIHCFQAVVITGLCWMTAFSPVYWNLSTNSLYVKHLARLATLRIYLLVVQYFGASLTLPAFGIPFYLILQLLAAKFMSTLAYRIILTKVSTSSSRPSSQDLYYAVFMHELLRIKSVRGDEMTPFEGELYLRTCRELFSNKKNTYYEDGTSFNLLFKYYEYLVTERVLNEFELHALLLIQIQNCSKFMAILPSTLHKISKKNVGKSSKSNFKYFHIWSLLQGRMAIMYSGLYDQSHFEFRSISDIYWDLSNCQSISDQFERPSQDSSSMSSKSINHNNLDIQRIFKVKDRFLSTVSQIVIYLQTKYELFSRIVEKPVHETSYLYQTHAKLRSLAAQIDSSFLHMVDTLQPTPYVLAAATAYFLKVRFNIREAESLFKRYKIQLTKLQSHSRNISKITNLNMTQNSVCMKVEVSKPNTGIILDISPGYKDYLGSSEREVLGMDVNCLFPGFMQEAHKEMMQELQTLSIFNKQKEFQLNGFDGFLRPLNFCIKLSCDSKGNIYALCLLRVMEANNQFMLILDENLDIMSAEIGFWKIMQSLGCVYKQTNLREVSGTLCVNLNMLAIMNKMDPQEADDSFANYYKYLWKKTLKSSYAGFEGCGVQHKLNVDLAGPDSNTDVPITAYFSPLKFAGQNYHRIMLQFDLSNHREAGKQNAYMWKMNPRVKFEGKVNDTTSLLSLRNISISEQQRSRLSNHQMQPKREAQMSNLGDIGDIVNFETIIESIRKLTQNNGLLIDVPSKQLTKEVTESLLWVGSYVEQLENSKNPEGRPSNVLQDQYNTFRSQQASNFPHNQVILTLPQPNISDISHSLAVSRQGDNTNAMIAPPTNRTLTGLQISPETAKEIADPLLNHSLLAVNLNAQSLKQLKVTGQTDKDINTLTNPNPNRTPSGVDLAEDPPSMPINRLSRYTNRTAQLDKKLSFILEGQASRNRHSHSRGHMGTKIQTTHMQSIGNSQHRIVMLSNHSSSKRASEINSNNSNLVEEGYVLPQIVKNIQNNVVFASSHHRVEALLKNIVVGLSLT